MAGLYDWEKRSDGTQTCDILEVYSTGEREKLKQTVNAKILKHIVSVNNVLDDNKNGSEFVFSESLAAIADEEDEEDEEEEEIKPAPIIPLKELLSVKTVKSDTKDQLDWVHIQVDDI